jgi:uncharacterized membrane protein
MKKIGAQGTKWLKIAHIISVTLWFGGIISLVALRSGINLSVYEEVNATYQSMRVIDDYIIRNGAQGILLTSIIYSIWTNWGFFKNRWVAVKWVVFLAQMLFGIIFLNTWVGANISMLSAEKGLALSNPVFIQNHSFIQIGAISQIILVIFLICVSVLKPWKKKNVAS